MSSLPRPGSAPGEMVKAASRGATAEVELVAVSEGQGYRYRVPLSPVPAQPRHPGQPWTGLGRGYASSLRTHNWEEWTAKKGLALPPSVLLRLEATRLAQAVPNAPDPTIMAPDGSGLHTALANMALNDPDSWQQLQADLRRIIPTIRRLRHTKTANVNQPASLLFDAIGADSLSAQQVSEGTLLVLGLLAGLYAPGRPSLMLLDDLDRGLHSKAQKDLISLLRGLLEASPGLQILASTHSPYMLDCMETKEVRMTVLRDDGATVCGPLSNHPQFEKWKDEMAPGEMWSLFGEKWLLEQGAPACKPRIAVVHEAPADYQTATELADRILLEAIDWLDEDLLAHQREWLAETPAGEPLTWRGIKHLARDRGIRAHGHFGGEPALPDAAAARRAILFLLSAVPDLAAIVLIRDQDDEPERKDGLEQARAEDNSGIPIVVGLAIVERECWVLSGFDPRGNDESARLDMERQRLGFDPRLRSHELTACKNDQADRSPKRVLRHLSGNDHDRERRCWRETSLANLRDRGADNGLVAYLDEIRERLSVLIGHPT